jgi:ElaB/YqjD/DUF883 family membrane-anchored ribosome-binding protein
VESTENELGRAAARRVVREARAEVNRQVNQLLTDVQALVDRLRDVADTEFALLRDRIENAVAATKAALTDRAQQALDRGERVGVFVGGRWRRLARGAERV